MLLNIKLFELNIDINSSLFSLLLFFIFFSLYFIIFRFKSNKYSKLFIKILLFKNVFELYVILK